MYTYLSTETEVGTAVHYLMVKQITTVLEETCTSSFSFSFEKEFPLLIYSKQRRKKELSCHFRNTNILQFTVALLEYPIHFRK